MASMPHVPWDDNVDEHLDAIHRHIHEGLAHFCPRLPTGPRSQITSSATWLTIRDRRALRRLQHEHSRALRLAEIRCLFQAWRGELSNIDDTSSHHTARLTIALLAVQIKAKSRLIRSVARQDAAEHTRQAFAQAKGKGPEALHRLLRHVTKVGRKYKKPPLQPAIVEKGTAIAEDSDLLLGRHFASAERALESTADQVATRPAVSAVEPLEPVREISIASLSRAFSKLTCKKASGLSGIPPEALRYASLEAARCHYPLLLKMIMRAQTPNLWRGGLAFPIEKPNKCPSQLSAWRSILLVESGAKAIAKAVRPSIIQAYRSLRQEAQGGSLPRLPLQMAMGHIRGYLRRLKEDNLSGGVLFIDGQAAFYSTLRQRLLGEEDSESIETLRWLSETCFEDEPSRLRFLSSILGPGLLSRTDTPEAIRRLVVSNLDCSWFATGAGGKHIFRSHSGTVPGAPLADILFQEIFSTAIANLRQRLSEAGVLASLRARGSPHRLELPMPSWMDDLAIPIAAASATSVVPHAQTTVIAVAAELRDIGVSMNLCAGKTELIPVFSGTHSRKERCRWLTTEPASFPVQLENGEQVRVHFTSSYVHLGSVVDTKGGDAADLQRRRVLARELLKPQMKIMRNPWLSKQEKLSILIAGPLSRLRHGAGLWELRGDKDRGLWTSGYMELLRKVFRQITGISSRGMSDNDVCNGLGMLDAAETRRVDIIRHAGWLLCEHSPTIQELWFEQGSWLNELKTALRHCADISKGPCKPTLDALLCNPAQAKVWAHRLSVHYGRVRKQSSPRTLHLWKQFEEVQSRGWIFLHVNVDGVCHQGSHQCPSCHLAFQSQAALASHQAKVHQLPSRAARASNATRCEVCCKEFWDTRRFHLHLRKSPGCMSVTEAADLDPGLSTHKSFRFAWQPATPVCGPRPFWATLRPQQPEETESAKPLPPVWPHVPPPKECVPSILRELALKLINIGLRFELTEEDLPLTLLHQQHPAYGLVVGAMRASSFLRARSAGRIVCGAWTVLCLGERAIFLPTSTVQHQHIELPEPWQPVLAQ